MVGRHSSSSSGVESIIPVSTRMRPSGCSITCRWPGTVSPSTRTSEACTGCTSASRIEPPCARDALQLVLAALLEGDPGAGDEVAHRARDEHLARPGEGRDARAGVNRDAAHLPVRELALAGVEPGSELEPEPPDRLLDRVGGPDCPRRSVECCEEAVPRGVDLLPPETVELDTNGLVVRLEQLAPAPVAELHRALRRADDVGEEDGREDAVGLGRRPRPGQELLDLVHDLVGVDPRDVVVPGQLDEACARDVLGDVAPLVHM